MTQVFSQVRTGPYTFKPLKSRPAKITENYISFHFVSKFSWIFLYPFILCQSSFFADNTSDFGIKKRGKFKGILTLKKKKLYYFWAALKNYKKSSQKLKVFSGNKAIDSPPFDDKLSQKCFIGSPGSFDRILVLHETISSILLIAKKVTVH